ncbi:hypothetical protein BSL78_24427 [Apostichopus japonicus]|uniref:CS domain-containing protein n=1 Tax=Stichopus japonicus TaxID=307972 RepID=A0A2G8JSJ2_STIJA|nr:hypothetical protein BSL78_24427 [Apostichopus japonicus]
MGVRGVHPPVTWAQRKDLIFITIEVSDVQKSPTIILEDQKLIFKGKGGVENLTYEVEMEFHSEISQPESKFKVRPRNVEFALKKKQPGNYWPRLLKDTTKQHWLKVDFQRWRDEDDEEDEEDPRELDQMLKDMGGINDGLPDMNDINNEESSDSDDDDMPDLEEDKGTTEEAKDS